MELPLKFDELYENMEIEDWWGEPGIVKECDDPHNVWIVFDNGGSHLYCMVEDCEEKDCTPIYKRWQHI
jgi:hypothetical protein